MVGPTCGSHEGIFPRITLNQKTVDLDRRCGRSDGQEVAGDVAQ